MERKIKISSDFSDCPGGRYKLSGNNSGEEFRDKILEKEYLKVVNNDDYIVIDLDDCMGFPSSFLDESFGELGRKYGGINVVSKLHFISNDQPGLVQIVYNMILGKRQQ